MEGRPRQGYDLSKLIEARPGGALKFRVASPYPLLYRLEKCVALCGFVATCVPAYRVMSIDPMAVLERD